jgi:hypothetical protein
MAKKFKMKKKGKKKSRITEYPGLKSLECLEFGVLRVERMNYE